jgi:hypothetical protein
LEGPWSLSVALDPKHRPQGPFRPSSTARRELWRYPLEAHLFDRAKGRYRGLLASEVAVLQGLPADWGQRAIQDELLLLRGYGDAVPPPLSRAVFAELPTLDWRLSANRGRNLRRIRGLCLGSNASAWTAAPRAYRALGRRSRGVEALLTPRRLEKRICGSRRPRQEPPEPVKISNRRAEPQEGAIACLLAYAGRQKP